MNSLIKFKIEFKKFIGLRFINKTDFLEISNEAIKRILNNDKNDLNQLANDLRTIVDVIENVHFFKEEEPFITKLAELYIEYVYFNDDLTELFDFFHKLISSNRVSDRQYLKLKNKIFELDNGKACLEKASKAQLSWKKEKDLKEKEKESNEKKKK